jgi:very-short-patch-repair endonuclease
MAAALTREYLHEEYVVKGRSTYDIASEHNTYSNLIIRLLKKFGIPRRTKGQAQAGAIKQGRHPHPTKGKERPDDVKYRISEGMARQWETMTHEERERRVQMSKKQWEAMGEKERQDFQKAATDAVRVAASIGSKLERHLLLELQRKKYQVEFHKEDLIPNERCHIDLFIPALRVAIEIDGPSHFLPIWGETERERQENLEKRIALDHQKTGLVLGAGFIMVRVKHICRSTSQVQKRSVTNAVLEILKKVEADFPAARRTFVRIGGKKCHHVRRKLMTTLRLLAFSRTTRGRKKKFCGASIWIPPNWTKRFPARGRTAWTTPRKKRPRTSRAWNGRGS